MRSRMSDLRDDFRFRQIDLAERLGISQNLYSRYETGKQDVPAAVLIQLAEIYSTSVDYILGLTNNPAPYERAKYPDFETESRSVRVYKKRKQ